MAAFFMDSSTLVKRYMPEKGTGWVRTLTTSHSGNDILIAQITPVEMISAIARQYHDGQINLTVFQSFRNLVLRHIQSQYQILGFSNSIVLRAIQLHEQYRLRAYDTVQLATALELEARLRLSARYLTFLSADSRLLAAAQSEGLMTDDPNLHP
jgi:uncharacterized protein